VVGVPSGLSHTHSRNKVSGWWCEEIRSEGKRPAGRPRRIWEDNIKMDLRVIGWGGTEWIHLA
jgi:hypothetical protein